MARQFREQLEEEVQLEEARKAQRAAAAAPVEPVAEAAAGAAAAATADAPGEGAGSAATPQAPANGAGNELNAEHAHHAPAGDQIQPTDPIQTAGAPGADPTAGQPAQAGGADERRT